MQTVSERFWAKVQKGKKDECWQWLAHCSRDGYGMLNVNNFADRAHRVSWRLHFGEIPKGIYVLHKCDNPPCVNPDHLWLGTQADNVRDMNEKGRERGSKGEAHPNAKLTAKQVKEIRRLYDGGLQQNRIAEMFPVSSRMIWHIVRRLNWTHI